MEEEEIIELKEGNAETNETAHGAGSSATESNENKDNRNEGAASGTTAFDLIFGETIQGVKSVGTVYIVGLILAIIAITGLLLHRIDSLFVFALLIIVTVLHAFSGKNKK